MNAIMFSFTFFTNFDSILRFVGFFEFLVDRWDDILAWFWQTVFQSFGLNVELNEVERVTISCMILSMLPFIAASAQARFVRRIPRVSLSIENSMRVAVILPAFLFLVFTWNLANYEMSDTAFYTSMACLFILLAILWMLHLWEIRKPSRRFRLAFLVRIVVVSIYQLWAILAVGVLYVTSKIIEMLPPFPVEN